MSAVSRIENVGTPRDLLELSLHIARRVAYPGLCVRDLLRYFDHLAEPIAGSLTQDAEGLRRLSAHFADTLRFRANASHYYVPENSFLNVVLMRRVGIPISLSIVYMALGHAGGLDLRGVGAPAHFLVRASVPGGTLYADPFHGGRVMGPDEAIALVAHLVPSMSLRPEIHLAPSPTGDVVRRLLANLKPIYLKRQRLETVERLLRVQTDLLPHDPMTWIERGAILVALKQRRLAADVTTRALLEAGGQPALAPQRAELLGLLDQQVSRRN